ncbi:hypothetical protein [Enhygromyxa salina]|uniref:hypothetical protein n=1 Tax=Enhygromyxa salina TaxID=215803 RepID=UPI003B8A714E
MRKHEPRWYPYLIVSIRPGLRVGEMLALRWADHVRLEQRQLRVELNYTRIGVIDSPKSDKAREVPLSWDAIEALRERRQRWAKTSPLVLWCGDDPPRTQHGAMLGLDRRGMSPRRTGHHDRANAARPDRGARRSLRHAPDRRRPPVRRGRDRPVDLRARRAAARVDRAGRVHDLGRRDRPTDPHPRGQHQALRRVAGARHVQRVFA